MNLHDDFGAHRISEDDVSDFVLNFIHDFPLEHSSSTSAISMIYLIQFVIVYSKDIYRIEQCATNQSNVTERREQSDGRGGSTSRFSDAET